jgi:hypothetical protein
MDEVVAVTLGLALIAPIISIIFSIIRSAFNSR